MTNDFATAAAQEAIDLHVLLQAWFRGETPDNLATILAHFDDGFTMITTAGALLTFEQLGAMFAPTQHQHSSPIANARPMTAKPPNAAPPAWSSTAPIAQPRSGAICRRPGSPRDQARSRPLANLPLARRARHGRAAMA
jgi:hypothetical protein